MPHPTQSEYTDANTGEKKMLPVLSASDLISYSNEDIQHLFEEGLIDEESKNFHDETMKKSYEDYKLMQELGMDEYIKKKNKTPKSVKEFSEDARKNKAYNDQLVSLRGHIYKDLLINKATEHLANEDPDITWLWTIRELVIMLASKDPSPVHFETARYYLREKAKVSCSSGMIDSFARNLAERCNDLKKFKTFNHPIFKKKSLTPEDLDEHFKSKKKELLSLDEDFIKYVNKFGETGKELANKIEEDSKKAYEIYKNSGFISAKRLQYWGLWTPQKDEKGKRSTINPMLKVLAKIIWEEELKQVFKRKKDQQPAIALQAMEALKPALSPKEKKQIIERGDIYVCETKSKDVVLTATIDPVMLGMMQGGSSKISSLLGHKLIRFFFRTGFDNWANMKEEAHKIFINGGYSELLHILNADNSPKNISAIKEILFVMAFSCFKFPNNRSGNLITLNVSQNDLFENKRPSYIIITLGDILCPGYTHQLEKGNKLLVPVPPFPQFYGKQKKLYASQSFFQLLIMEEFSNQSNRLHKNGSIKVEIDRWHEMGAEAGLTKSTTENVRNFWCQPDLLNPFLDKQGDEYNLTSYYEKELNFLKIQGKIRNQNSRAGKLSVKKRKKR